MGNAEGYDSCARTLVTCEGLLYYLPQPAVDRLLAAISAVMPAGSRLCFDFMQRSVLEGKEERAGFKVRAQHQ